MSSNLYSQGFGTTSSSNFQGSAIKQTRSPTSGDIQGPSGQYPIGQLWVDTAANAGWQLTSFSQSSGTLIATWSLLGGASSDVNTLSGDTGTALPVSGNIKIAGGVGVVTTASGSTVTVALTGGDRAIDQIAVDASTAPGTNPVKSDINGQITVTGGQVAAGTTANVIQTNSLADNAYTIQVQRTSASAVSSTANNGVGSFNTGHFSVDTNGYVSLVGGGQAIDSFTPNSGTTPVVPAADGSVSIIGSGSTTTVGGLNSLTVELTGLTDHNVLVGAGTSTITNVSPSTSGFVLTSNGLAADPSFQSVAASGAITTITGDSGGAETPTSLGNFNLLGSGSITTVGTANTETIELTGLTNHAVLVGAGTSTITKVGPTATAGQVLQSAGASADPAFSTATYPSTTTINEILYSSATNTVTGLTTANRAVLTTSATGVPELTQLATNGQVIIGSTVGAPAAATLTPGAGIGITNGSNSITISNTLSVVTQTFTTSGTYTPTSGMVYCTVEVVGGGGGGGAIAATAAGEATAAGGGGGGGYARKIFSAATIGASQTVTIGTAGTGGAAGANPGGTGGTTSLGVLISATGGNGGQQGSGGFPAISTNGGSGGTGSSGDFNTTGGAGGGGIAVVSTFGASLAGVGGNSFFGGGATGVSSLNTVNAGNAANSYGGGGGGACGGASQVAAAGGNGFQGIIVITEYVL